MHSALKRRHGDVWHQQGRVGRMLQAEGTSCTQTTTLWLPLCGKGIRITILAALWSPSSRPDLMLTAYMCFSGRSLPTPQEVGTLSVHLTDEETEAQRCLVTCPVCYPCTMPSFGRQQLRSCYAQALSQGAS